MARQLQIDDVEAAVLAGLLLSCGGSGGSGINKNCRIGEAAVRDGVRLVTAAELDPDAAVIVTTGVGAPASSVPRVQTQDAVESARLLAAGMDKPLAAVMPAHVPGMNAWLVASALNVPLLDAASNGRGHPTPMFGAMGFADDLASKIGQIAVGRTPDGDRVEVKAFGSFLETSNRLREAAQENGGLILAARGPMPVRHVQKFGALGAISHQLSLGRVMVGPEKEGMERIELARQFLAGEILADGEVIENSVQVKDGLDVGTIKIRSAGGVVELGVCNEFMYADRSGKRLYTFPDLIAALNPHNGQAFEVSELKSGTRAVAIATRDSNLPMGEGAFSASAFEEIERVMRVSLKRSNYDI